MRRILLTGGAGFIGRHLLERLQNRHEVIVLGRSQPMQTADTPIAWIEHDLTDPLDVSRLPQRVDAVIHLAQSQVYRQFPERAEEIFDVNVKGTLQLAEYARSARARQFIFASSGGVYRLSRAPISETGAIEPLSFYLSTKYASEVLLRNYEQFLTMTTLRLFFVYGPGQQPGMLIPAMARRVQNDERVTVEGNPGLHVNPVHVTDAVRAIDAALETEGAGIVNVAGNDVISITGLVELIASLSGKQVTIEHAPSTAAGDLVADTTRLRTLLGVVPHVRLADGLGATLQSMKSRDESC